MTKQYIEPDRYWEVVNKGIPPFHRVFTLRVRVFVSPSNNRHSMHKHKGSCVYACLVSVTHVNVSNVNSAHTLCAEFFSEVKEVQGLRFFTS